MGFKFKRYLSPWHTYMSTYSQVIDLFVLVYVLLAIARSGTLCRMPVDGSAVGTCFLRVASLTLRLRCSFVRSFVATPAFRLFLFCGLNHLCRCVEPT